MALHLLRRGVGMNVIPKLSSARVLRVMSTMNHKGNCTGKPQPQVRRPPEEEEEIFQNHFPCSLFASSAFGFHELDTPIECARHAIDIHNENEHANLQFVRMLNAGYEIVGGQKIFIMLEATDAAGKLAPYFAIVLFRAWAKEAKDKKIVTHFGPLTW